MAAAPAWLDELHARPGPPWHHMGLRSVGEAGWLLPGDDEAEQLAAKQLLVGQHHDQVAVALPGSEAACAEAAELVARHTGRPLDASRPALEAAAVVVAEDLCLLVRRDGQWRLEAAVVCFPSLWCLGEKMGLSVTALHAPVPSYDDELASRVERFMDRLAPDRPVWRRNWFVHDTPVLHLPGPLPERPRPEVPGGLWLRSERQALRRLAVSGPSCSPSAPSWCPWPRWRAGPRWPATWPRRWARGRLSWWPTGGRRRGTPEPSSGWSGSAPAAAGEGGPECAGGGAVHDYRRGGAAASRARSVVVNNPGVLDNLRVLVALKLSRLAGWVAGGRPLPENEQLARARRALGEITALVPAGHPACIVAVEALGDEVLPVT